ncbi:vacuolar protein sorting-associated protein 52 homolog [Cricetulus griseus]|uniref:vacuolar protein sorting-associated protein 52 homolog n=1 Tax=Cricetulus griseus TaxID=10029 RepID=UPI0015C3DF14|nr:vacuolar protein sorting-associated protein 52 homolog [Cricetulus griseus]
MKTVECPFQSPLSSLLHRAILEAPVTEPRFLEQLQELDAKAAAVREQEARGTAACADVRGVLDRLRVKAVTKIREFILQKIYSFRKPMTNYQIPQTALLKYRFFCQFLLWTTQQRKISWTREPRQSVCKQSPDWVSTVWDDTVHSVQIIIPRVKLLSATNSNTEIQEDC